MPPSKALTACKELESFFPEQHDKENQKKKPIDFQCRVAYWVLVEMLLQE